MKLTAATGSLGLWLSLRSDALLVIGGLSHSLERRLLTLGRTMRRLREAGDHRPLIAPIFTDEPSPLSELLSEPARVQAVMTAAAGGLPVVTWLNTQARWAELLASVRLQPQQDVPALLDLLRADPRAGGLPAALLLDRLIEVIQQTTPAHGERLLDTSRLAAVLQQSGHDLHRWARQRADWRRRLWIADRTALEGQPAALSSGLLVTPWSAELAELPSAHLSSSRQPYQGQHELLRTLIDWISGPEDASFRLLTGPSGSGKTRTAFELCQLLGAHGWTAGFLSEGPSPEQCSEIINSNSDRLIVVDNAEDRQEEIELIRGAARGRLRVLALSTAQGWWSGAPALSLQPVPPQDRLSRLRLAARVYAADHNLPPPRVVNLPDPALLRWPLDLQMAAILAVHRMPADDLPPRFLALERRRWPRCGLDDEFLAQLTGAAPPRRTPYTRQLPQLLSDQLILEALQSDPAPLTRLHTARPALLTLCRLAGRRPQARAWLRAVLQQDDAYIPQALAAACTLSRQPAATPLGALLPAHLSPQEAPLRGLTVSYSRQAMLPLSEMPDPDPLPPLQLALGADQRLSRSCGHRSAGGRPPTLLTQVFDALRSRLSVLLPHHIIALEALEQPHTVPLEAARAAALLRLPAARTLCLELALSLLGLTLTTPQMPQAAASMPPPQAREALVLLQAACGHRTGPPDALSRARRLLDELPIPDDLLSVADELQQAGSIAGFEALIAPLSAHLQGLRPRWPHCDVLRADLAIRRSLHQRPATLPAPDDTHTPAQRILLHIAQVAIGEPCAPALSAILAILCEQEQQDPVRLRPIRVAVQDTAARWLHEQGDHPRAAALLKEAVAGLEDLPAHRPVLLDPFLGLSLHNLSAHLHALREDSAIDAALSAAEAWRRQTRRSGETFLTDLAATLGNLGAMLTHTDRPEDALVLLRKSISLCWGGAPEEALAALPDIRTLLAAPPTATAPPDTLILRERQHTTVTFSRPYFLWRFSELTATLEDGELTGLSDRIWQLHHTTPDQLRPQLADALQNLGGALSAAGHLSAAAAATSGAVAVLRRLTGAQLALAVALDNLSALHGLTGAAEASVAAAEEAVALLRQADAAAPLAGALSNLSAALYTLGCHQHAAAVAAEAIELHAVPPDVRVMALFNLSLARQHSGEPAAALDALRAALSEQARPLPILRERYQRMLEDAGLAPAPDLLPTTAAP